MRRLFLSWRGFEVTSRRWRGATEYGLVWTGRFLLWTWRHRQGVWVVR